MYKTYEDVPEALQPYYVKGEKITIGFHFEEGAEEPVREYAHRTAVIDFGDCVTWAQVAAANQGAQLALCDFAENQDRKHHFEALTNWFATMPEDGEHPFAQPVLATSHRRQYEVALAKEARAEGRYKPIEVAGRVYDADPESYMNLTGTLESWEALIASAHMAAAGMVDGDRMKWTLSDNTDAWLTRAELKAVVDALRERYGLLHAQYRAAKQ